MREVICPACGAITEARDDTELIDAAREHGLDAHQYEIPAKHILAAAADAS